MDRRLPDTPWHVGYALKDEDDPRRHKSRCIHYEKGKCKSSRSNHYMENCISSSHCSEYSENHIDYEKQLRERMTAEEIERENIAKYKSSLVKKKQELAKSNNLLCHKETKQLSRCLVCDDGLKNIKKSLRKCLYCGMYYVNIADSVAADILDIVKADDVFLMNIPRNNETKNSGVTITNSGICKHMKKNGRCTNESSRKYTQNCVKTECQFFEK